MIGRKNEARIPSGVWAAALAVALAGAPAWGAPGDPLGGDDTGCAPTTSQGISCAKKVVTLLYKLRASLVKCHNTQVTLAFKNGSGTPGFSNAEENCSVGPSNTSAKAKFDNKIADLAGAGCDATLLANANAAAAVILGDQSVTGSADALNGTFFCDTTSGNPIDPGGDDAGTIPSTPGHLKCGIAIAKAYAKLNGSLAKCHIKLAAYVFKGAPFDEELCEEGVKGALGKYDYYVNKYVTAGICPPCLVDPGPTNALDLGTSTVTDTDANLGSFYICPGP